MELIQYHYSLRPFHSKFGVIGGRSQHPDLKDGGALQLSLSQVMLQFSLRCV